MRWNILSIGGHYEVYADGRFVFSADTRAEVTEELRLWEENEHIA